MKCFLEVPGFCGAQVTAVTPGQGKQPEQKANSYRWLQRAQRGKRKRKRGGHSSETGIRCLLWMSRPERGQAGEMVKALALAWLLPRGWRLGCVVSTQTDREATSPAGGTHYNHSAEREGGVS